jgi:hypothetical protein
MIGFVWVKGYGLENLNMRGILFCISFFVCFVIFLRLVFVKRRIFVGMKERNTIMMG